MAWNGPVNGDWGVCDFTKPPFAGGCAELTHEEVLFVIENTAPFVALKPWDDFYVVSEYNKAINWEEAINGDTYAVIKSYDPAIHTLGIDGNGIVVEEEEPEPPVEEGE